MFVFGDEGRHTRRIGVPGALILLAVACVATMGMLWQPERGSAPAPASSAVSPSRYDCTPGTLRAFSVDGGPVDPRALSEAILANDAKACEYHTAHDLARGRFADTPAARSEAEAVNVGVEAAICPEPSACLERRYSTASDVAVVRDALVRLGYPEAEVRSAEHVGESPEHDVVYGVRLHAAEGCLVSFARTGVGVAPMGPVGILGNGRCLHTVA